MSQEFKITWVGDQTRQWQGRHGEFVDYRIALEGYDAAKSVVLTQKPDTPPPTVGQVVYGGIVVDTPTDRDGETFEVHKLKKERRPDNGQTTNTTTQPQKFNGSSATSNGPSPEFWAQKDQRIARAGVLQAVVSGGVVNAKHLDVPGWVQRVNEITDALLASLDEKAPHPNDVHAEKPLPAPAQPTLEDAVLAPRTPEDAENESDVDIDTRWQTPDDDIPF